MKLSMLLTSVVLIAASSFAQASVSSCVEKTWNQLAAIQDDLDQMSQVEVKAKLREVLLPLNEDCRYGVVKRMVDFGHAIEKGGGMSPADPDKTTRAEVYAKLNEILYGGQASTGGASATATQGQQ